MATKTSLADSIDSLYSSHLLGSVSSLTPSKRSGNQIARVYKQAKNDFVQQSFVECLATLEPLITPRKPEDDSSNEDRETTSYLPAPIASADHSLRVKVWSLYITLLSTIIDLGPEEGKNRFGSNQWRAILSKVRDGSVWEEVVRDGYSGDEGSVDADVVSNLANLLITHSPSQTLNQQRLETYFSSSSHPNLDISDRFDDSSHDISEDRPQRAHLRGTDTPRDLNTRIKVLELYALHVLPRNEEWEYAKEFISMSEILDEDRREEFLQTLQALEDKKEMDANREEVIMRQRDEELERERQEADKRRQEESRLQGQRQQQPHKIVEPNHKRSNSEKDYGIEDPHPNAKTARKQPGPSSLKNSKSSQQQNGTRLTPASRRTPGSSRKAAPRGLVARGAAMISMLQKLTTSMAQSITNSPAALLRFVLFMLALLVAVGRQDVRERIARVTGLGWDRLKKTVGMGVKVSYI